MSSRCSYIDSNQDCELQGVFVTDIDVYRLVPENCIVQLNAAFITRYTGLSTRYRIGGAYGLFRCVCVYLYL